MILTYNTQGKPQMLTGDALLAKVKELYGKVDLSQFVDKKVRVTLRNGGVEEGFVKSTLHYDYPFSINLNHYSNNGEWKHSEHRKYDIIQIEEIKPMIDLSQFVDKKVRVTLRNGSKDTGSIIKNRNKYSSYPFIFLGNDYNYEYLRNGRNDLNYVIHSKNIIQIEEIKPMNKYEELEKQVAEMQKEIDRLKREEEKNCLNLKPVEITRTVKITPEDYYEYCKEYKEKPTATGYVKYYSSSGWFMDSGDYTETFKVIEN